MKTVPEERSTNDFNPVSNINNVEIESFPKPKKDFRVNNNLNQTHEENPFSTDNPSPLVGYPKFTNPSSGNAPGLSSKPEASSESTTGNYNQNQVAFDSFKNNYNETELNNKHNNLPANNSTQKNISNNNNNNYDSNFDFTGFNDFKVDSFKEFANKKGDDFFKNQGDFQANWDEF